MCLWEMGDLTLDFARFCCAINMHHAASYQYQAYPPTPTEALEAGRVFSLPQSKVQKAAREVISAVERWQEFASVAGVSGEDAEKVSRVIRL